MLRIFVLFAVGIKRVARVGVVLGMANQACVNGIGVNVKHHLEEMFLVFDFRGFRSIIGDLALPVVLAVVIGAELGMGISHPISQCLDTILIAMGTVLSYGAGLVDVISHEAKAVNTDGVTDFVFISTKKLVQIGALIRVVFENIFPVMPPPHLVKDAGGSQCQFTTASHA